MFSLSNSWRRVVAVFGVTMLSACASTDYHFSQLYGTRYNRAPIDTYDVTIVRVDGKDTMFRLHGTIEPDTIGQAVSSGCIRLFNQDIIDLYDRVPVGAQVKVVG